MGSLHSAGSNTLAATGSADPRLDEVRVRAQLDRGFRRLQFEPRLEDAYRDHMHRRLLRRVPLISVTALVFFLVYSVLDYVLFPLSVSGWTIPIRLFVVCPIIILVMVAAYRRWDRRAFFLLYGASYAVGGLAIVAIILVAHSQKVMMPYDGLFLALIFGYFLMALPFYQAIAISWLIYGVYLCVELMVNLPMSVLLYNAFFLLTANMIGTVGSYIQEHAYRTNFLNLCQIRASRQRAEEENRAKTKFLATASHDLRQPLHAMNLMLAHLGDRLQGSEEGTIVAKVKQSVELLNQLLRSLLDISRLNVGIVKPKYQHFPLNPLIGGISVDFETLALEQGIAFQAYCPGESFVYSDPILLERMVRNLLSNAFKHASAEQIQLTVEAVGQAFVLKVTDNGKGIPEAELDKIFLEFHQGAEERQSQKSGLGLGLAIVKHLALLMDYDLGVESAPGKGATFWVRVPKGLPALIERSDSDKRTEGVGAGQRILLIENDQTSLDAMASLLRSWGYAIDLAISEREAQECAVKARPDLVISDYRLGNQEDGLTIIRNLRGKLRPDLPAILVTADTDNSLSEQARQLGVLVAYKPLIPAQLKLMMRRQLAVESDSR